MTPVALSGPCGVMVRRVLLSGGAGLADAEILQGMRRHFGVWLSGGTGLADAEILHGMCRHLVDAGPRLHLDVLTR